MPIISGINDANTLQGHAPGHASGNIPIADGTVVTNLNADMVDGFHASQAASATAHAVVTDAAGRAKVVAPAASSDIALLQTVSDAVAGEASARTTALASKADLVAGLVPSSQLPSYVDDILEYANFAAFPGTGETGKIYVALDTNFQYRWSGSAYIVISQGNATPSWLPTITYGLNRILEYLGILYKSKQTGNLNHDPSTDSTGTWWVPAGGGSTIIDFYTYGASITAGDVVNITPANVKKAFNSKLITDAISIGIALDTGASSATGRVQTAGIAKGITSGKTAGDFLYLSQTAGAMTTDLSATSAYGMPRILVAVAINATDLLICPQIIEFVGAIVANDSGRYGVSDYALYNDSAAIPVDGTGGSATALTKTRNTTTPMGLISDISLAKSASNAQGQGMSYDFNIDLGDTGSSMQIDLRILTGTNYANGDLIAYLYDKTNSVFVALSNTSISSSNGGISQFTSVFTPTSSTSYRLIFHIATTNASAWTVRFAKINIQPQITISGPVLSDEFAYTPTFQSFGTVTNINFKWRRVGNKMQVRGTFTAGTLTAVEAQIGLPSIGVNTPSDLPTISLAGKLDVGLSGSSTDFQSRTVLMEASKTYITVGAENSASNPLVKANPASFCTNGSTISLFFEVPIAQWSVNATFVGINEPFCLSNNQSGVNTNGTTANTYNGFDGSLIVANTAVTTYDMTLPRALLPNEVPIIELYSKIDGNWISANEASVPSLFVAGMVARRASDGVPNLYYEGFWLAKVSSSVLRIYQSDTMRGGASAWATSASTSRTWANIIAAADGFTRWRVRIGKAVGVAEVAVQSDYVKLDSGNGHGSTNTKIRRYTNSSVFGASMTYADSAANGMSVTINQAGLYYIENIDLDSGAAFIWGASVNSNQLTTAIQSITAANILMANVAGSNANGVGNYVGTTVRLSIGDVVRAHDDGGPNGTTFTGSRFKIVKIGN